MEPGDVLRLIILFILILLSAFFSSAETAFMSVNKIKLRSEADDGSKRAALILKLLDNSTKLLSTILVGNNLVNIVASSLTTTLMIKLFGSTAVGIATGLLTLVILIFGEITPKTLATRKAERFAAVYAPLFRFLMFVMTPVTFLVTKLANGVLFICGVDPDGKNEQVTEDELLTYVDVSHEDGVLETDEREMINNVIDFGDTLVKDVMVPSINMKCVPDNIGYDELIKAFREDEYSRMPVYNKTIDNIVGVIWAKDILLKYDPSFEEPFDIKALMREPYFTYDHKHTRELMSVMREEYKSMAIVLDEYNTTAGLITIEDLIEEIVGEIRDEYDLDEVDSITALPDNTYEVQGQTIIEDVNDEFGLNIESDDYGTIAGHVIHLLGHIPAVGESVTEDGVTYIVTNVDKNRVDSIKIIINRPSESADSRESNT
ncbi:MAG: hemolysin family protein [Lachnospiraceae bacterium]|nr:hemolysin family protein [Lachnospiraceae bacterium]